MVGAPVEKGLEHFTGSFRIHVSVVHDLSGSKIGFGSQGVLSFSNIQFNPVRGKEPGCRIWPAF